MRTRPQRHSLRKRSRPARPDSHQTEIEPIRGESLHYEAARERVEGEQAGEPENNAAGAANAKERGLTGTRAAFSIRVYFSAWL